MQLPLEVFPYMAKTVTFAELDKSTCLNHGMIDKLWSPGADSS